MDLISLDKVPKWTKHVELSLDGLEIVIGRKGKSWGRDEPSSDRLKLAGIAFDKRYMFQPAKMFIAREIIHKSRQYQISFLSN